MWGMVTSGGAGPVLSLLPKSQGFPSSEMGTAKLGTERLAGDTLSPLGTSVSEEKSCTFIGLTLSYKGK